MTSQQHRCLEFIRAYIAEHGFSPSYDEIAAHIGVSSKSGVLRILTALELLGKIRRIPNAARSIELIRVSQPNAALAELIANRLLAAHGFDDGDGPLIVFNEKELRAALLEAISA